MQVSISLCSLAPLRPHSILAILFDMKIGAAFLWFVLTVSCSTAASSNSGGAFASDWSKVQEPQVFRTGHLYDYIDGGAELYEEFGVVQLTVHQYRKAQDELELLVYEMESPESALGIYLMQAGTERPIAGIKARNSGSTSQISAVRGNSYVQITSLNSSPDVRTPMVNLANWALDPVPDEKPVALFSLLPRDSLIFGSERIFHGPLGLNQVLHIFSGNPMGLGGSVWGVGAKYRLAEGVVEIQLSVKYADERAAHTALSNLGKGMDSSYSLVSTQADEFEFKSAQGDTLSARIDKKHLILRLIPKFIGKK